MSQRRNGSPLRWNRQRSVRRITLLTLHSHWRLRCSTNPHRQHPEPHSAHPSDFSRNPLFASLFIFFSFLHFLGSIAFRWSGLAGDTLLCYRGLGCRSTYRKRGTKLDTSQLGHTFGYCPTSDPVLIFRWFCGWFLFLRWNRGLLGGHRRRGRRRSFTRTMEARIDGICSPKGINIRHSA